jgi:hypothetical protein
VLFFASFAICATALALISAVIFSLFWIGVASLVLVPALFVTFSIAVLVWLWAVATFLVGRWIYNMMPVQARGDVAVKMPNGKQVVFQKGNEVYDGAGFNIDVKSEVANDVSGFRE